MKRFKKDLKTGFKRRLLWLVQSARCTVVSQRDLAAGRSEVAGGNYLAGLLL